MPYAISIGLKDGCSAELAELSKNLQPDAVNPVVGRAGVNVVRQHLFSVDQTHANKLGGKRTHFFADAARSTNFREEGSGVTVSINHVGIGLRYFGGEVRPQNAKVLTIPAIAEAHGRRAGEFQNLEIVWPKGRSTGALVEVQHTEIKVMKDRRKGQEGKFRIKKVRDVGYGKVFFWLVAKATMQPDPSVLPSGDLIATACRNGLLNSIAAKYHRLGSGL